MASPEPGATSPAFESAAVDQLAALIEEERADASHVLRQQLEHLDSQFSAFRSAAMVTHAENEAINALNAQDLRDLHYTLRQAGIHYFQGRLSFGVEWGDVIQGFRPPAADVPPPRFTPQEIINMLQWQRRENLYRRDQASAQIGWLKQELSSAQNHDYCQTQSTFASPVDVDSRFAVKRISNSQVRISKRPKLILDTNYAPSFNPCLPTSTSSPSSLGRVIIPAHSSAVLPESCRDLPLTAPPVIENWNLALADAEITSQVRAPPRSVIPPLPAFAGAHSCSYYLWFATRSFLFRQLASGSPVHTSWTTQEWELKLHNINRKSSLLDACGDGDALCDCGAPRMSPTILSQLRPLRADGTTIQVADFKSESLQALLCADIELARAKLQFEQTDDIVLDVLLWSPQQLLNRIQARRNIFRSSWDPSFAAVPLEKDNIEPRRPWIIQFAALLQEWPDFASIGYPPAFITADSQDLDSSALIAYERRLLAFYLKTVSKTLGLYPALPRQRPSADLLPVLYRDFMITEP